MNLCKIMEQTPGQSIYEHGRSVWMHYHSLFIDRSIELPDCIKLHFDFLKDRQLDDELIEVYLTWHDIGKPLCFDIDANGKWHFHGHAIVSEEAWRAYHDCETDPSHDDIAMLIGRDLDLLAGTPSTLDKPDDYTATQIFCAWAALYSNAGMFGGTDSTSFKIKRKKLERNTKHLLRLMKEI